MMKFLFLALALILALFDLRATAVPPPKAPSPGDKCVAGTPDYVELGEHCGEEVETMRCSCGKELTWECIAARRARGGLQCLKKEGETCGVCNNRDGDCGTCGDNLTCECVGACADEQIADAPSTCVAMQAPSPGGKCAAGTPDHVELGEHCGVEIETMRCSCGQELTWLCIAARRARGGFQCLKKEGETCGVCNNRDGDCGTCGDNLTCECVGDCADEQIADAPSTCVATEDPSPGGKCAAGTPDHVELGEHCGKEVETMRCSCGKELTWLCMAARRARGVVPCDDKSCKKEGGDLACGEECTKPCPAGEFCTTQMKFCQADGSCEDDSAPTCKMPEPGGKCAAGTADYVESGEHCGVETETMRCSCSNELTWLCMAARRARGVVECSPIAIDAIDMVALLRGLADKIPPSFNVTTLMSFFQDSVLADLGQLGATITNTAGGNATDYLLTVLEASPELSLALMSSGVDVSDLVDIADIIGNVESAAAAVITLTETLAVFGVMTAIVQMM